MMRPSPRGAEPLPPWPRKACSARYSDGVCFLCKLMSPLAPLGARSARACVTGLPPPRAYAASPYDVGPLPEPLSVALPARGTNSPREVTRPITFPPARSAIRRRRVYGEFKDGKEARKRELSRKKKRVTEHS